MASALATLERCRRFANAANRLLVFEGWCLFGVWILELGVSGEAIKRALRKSLIGTGRFLPLRPGMLPPMCHQFVAGLLSFRHGRLCYCF